MPLHIPGAVSPVATVKMVGPIVQWASALLLVGVFALLIPLASQRRSVMVWMTAWIAQVVAITRTSMESLFMVFAPHHPRPDWLLSFNDLYWPARAVFLAAVAIGAIGTVRAISPRAQQLVLLLAAVGGMVIGFASLGSLATRIQLIAMPLVCFGSAQVVLLRADGPRRRGLTFLGLALALFGAVSTLYLMAFFEYGSTSSFARFVEMVSVSSGYGDALALGVLAAAIIVVAVQDSLLESSRAHAARLEQVAGSEQRLNGIIEAAREAIITADEDHRIDLVNGAAAALFQVAPGEAVGRPVDAFILDASSLLDDAEAGAPSDATALTTHVGCGVRTDGSSFPLEFTVGRLAGASRAGSVMVLRDLTARQAAEAEREEFDRRMAESEKMLAIGRVVSGVAHELNNPLAVVLGQSEQLATSAPTGELRSGLRMIYEQANRARHIVKDLLAFVRHHPRALQPVNLGEVVQQVAASQVEAMNARGVTLLTDVPSGLPPVVADRQAIEQILVNLIDNGLDAAGREGSVHVSVATAGTHVEIVVEDSGHGAAPEVVRRVFEPFFTTKGPGQGTGLGLAVSRELAENHGGTLTFLNRPAPGIGARLVLSFPAGRAGSVPDVTRISSAFPSPPAPRAHAGADVMLIDDEPAVRATLKRMFDRAGWHVREADGGAAALLWLLNAAEADTPAVILCDLKMPGMNGREVYERVLEGRPVLAPRFIFVTGDVVESISNGFIAESGRDVVEKPFTIAEIAAAVDRIVQQG